MNKQTILEKIKEKGIRKTTLRHYNTDITIWKGPQQSEHFIIFEEDKMEMLLNLLFIKKEYMNVTERSVMGGKRLLLWNIGDLWYRFTNPKLVKLFKEELIPNFTEVHIVL